MVKILYAGSFYKDLQDLLLQDSHQEESLDLCVKRFQKNPDDTRIKSHNLTGKMAGKCAFSVTGDLRIIYEWLGDSTVRFPAIGTHREIYKKNVTRD